MQRSDFIRHWTKEACSHGRNKEDAIMLACELADRELDNPDNYWLEDGICPACESDEWLIPIDTEFWEYLCLNCGEKYVVVE